jgi:hypothetical protein
MAPKKKTEAVTNATIPHQPTRNAPLTQGSPSSENVRSDQGPRDIFHWSRICSHAHVNRLHSCCTNSERGWSPLSATGSASLLGAARFTATRLPRRQASAASAEGAGRRGNFLSYSSMADWISSMSVGLRVITHRSFSRGHSRQAAKSPFQYGNVTAALKRA